MILGITHLGMSVSDLDASIEFYRTLGMEVVMQGSFGGRPCADVMKCQDAAGRAAMLRGAKFQIEMFECADAPARAPDLAGLAPDVGLTHFCVEVIDIDVIHQRLLATHAPQVDLDIAARALCTRDPDGNVIEFRQPAASRVPIY